MYGFHLTRSSLLAALLPFIVLLGAAEVAARTPRRAVDYLTQIKPLLASKCYACHGALKQRSGLRLETRALMLRGGDSGRVVVPGRAVDSELLGRITATGEGRMPPASDGLPLTKDEVALIREWIDQGALAPDEPIPSDPREHWAFQPIIRPSVPTHTGVGWSRNPIDSFLARRHQDQKLTPQPAAARLLLFRRLYIDLIGIPPSAQESAALATDVSVDWYERAVARLLNDPRHGERWARHWMDIWRYSDWWGLGSQLRNSQKHIWHWRDWIIESLNDDTPYDEMVRLMLAADESHPNDLGKLRATGFLARNYFLFNRPQWMEETVEHVSKGLLGLTINCAKCHDHKYDPIAQTDFYRMRAFFEPYHVRLDVVPGELNVAKDGIPRVFDGLPDDPTYVYIRGDEKNPDKSRVVPPGVPRMFDLEMSKIKPVALPAEAWQPGRRPWVAAAYTEAARTSLAAAEADLKTANQQLAQAKKLAVAATRRKAASPSSGQVESVVEETFTALNKKRWRLFGGQWVHQAGQLEQQRDGAKRSVLRLIARPPRDFEVTLRFTIRGGRRWRSVGVGFDAAPGDPTRDTDPDYHEQNVYVSGHQTRPKIHAAYNDGGQWHYPSAPAVRELPIPLNRAHTLRVRVRGTLINVALNGQSVIACRTPLARRDGMLQLTTFDAVTVFHEVRVVPLPPEQRLRPPTAAGPQPVLATTDVAAATSLQQLAQAKVVQARAHLASTERRAAALQADPQERQATHAAAVEAERVATVATARHTVLVARGAVLSATGDKKKVAEKALQAAQKALAKAESTVGEQIQPTDPLTPFVGAVWTPTRFFHSTRDDPAVDFPSQSTGRRSALAGWITDRRNPLAARVAVNHIWTRHMGRPLVATVFDFGRKGTPPTHPQLLDWLAAELIDHHWSMKHLHQLIVTSAAYRMSSSAAGAQANTTRDRDNRFWWRRIPRRLESQTVRDSILAMAGTLDFAIGGPPVARAQQAKSLRRSLYFFHSNNERNRFLTTFDEASVKECYRREESVVPQQALALTNSGLVLDAAQLIAQQLSEDGKDEVEFIRNAFATLLGVTVQESEITASRRALDEWSRLAGGSSARARAHFVWALINHNDFITLR